MNIILRLLIAAVLVCGYSVDKSLAVDYKAIQTISVGTDVGSPVTWQVTAYQENTGKNYPQLQAKICFSHTDNPILQQCELTGGVEVVRNLEVIQFSDREKPLRGILLITNSYGIGGGPDYLSLWVYEKDKKHFKNILPDQMYIAALGTYKFFPSFQKMKSILIIASPTRLMDYNADLDNPDRETIWSPHYYIIDIYKCESQGFSKIGSFETKRKYDPEDEEKIIDSELMRIKALLR